MSVTDGTMWLGILGSETELNSDGINLTTEDKEIAREGRVANGSLVMDMIAVKKTFSLKIDAALGQDMITTMLALYEDGLDEVLSFLVEEEDGTITPYTVKFRPFSRTTMLRKDRWIYEGVTFVLEEV
jgi:hypothetical protein